MIRRDRLGRIRPALEAVRLEGNTRLIVNPIAAIGTDVLLISTGIATIALSRNPYLKILGGFGTAWGSVALFIETFKLIAGETDGLPELIRES